MYVSYVCMLVMCVCQLGVYVSYVCMSVMCVCQLCVYVSYVLVCSFESFLF